MTVKRHKDPTETLVRDKQVRILTYGDFYHVRKTKNAAGTVSLRQFEIMFDDAPVLVDESVDIPALSESFLQGVGVVVARKTEKRIMTTVFGTGGVNVLAAKKSASQSKLRIRIVRYSLDDYAPTAGGVASVYLLAC